MRKQKVPKTWLVLALTLTVIVIFSNTYLWSDFKVNRQEDTEKTVTNDKKVVNLSSDELNIEKLNNQIAVKNLRHSIINDKLNISNAETDITDRFEFNTDDSEIGIINSIELNNRISSLETTIAELSN
ncbi:hypothetical protein V6235_10800 [Vibrio metschnikovii]|uniref:hypothetical protein n=1 Tax=Vibrio metschnikovii TaxID=28172 RepID=UPI001302DD4E|nr:hypothetical protein [Vibrio metschnikovii]